MESIFKRQAEIIDQLKQVLTNFGKDAASRKTPTYIKKRLELVDNLWGEFDLNHSQLDRSEEDKSQQYFVDKTYQKTKQFYSEIRLKLAGYNNQDEIDDLLSQQRTNFRALKKHISRIHVNEISEKWEIEDELRSLQSKWSIIESLHLQIDNIIQGADLCYEDEHGSHELAYRRVKRELNQKLSSTAHYQQSTPQLEIPTFNGNYAQWPTFIDLFNETINNNSYLTKTQKMQHLKAKLRGDAERLIHHLNVTADNFDIAMEILTHRYNNPQVLFTKQIETFLNQPCVNRQTSFELKRLYDTTTECIHAIHNLGADTLAMDPLLVHLLAKKLDADTYSAYKEARRNPRELPTMDELMSFIETKFLALEPISNRKVVVKEVRESAPLNKPSYPPATRHPFYRKPVGKFSQAKGYQAAPAVTNPSCPVCKHEHNLFRCFKFINMPAETKLETVSKLHICKNCLFKHSEPCISSKRCKYCNSAHNTLLHDACKPQTGTRNESAFSAEQNASKSHSANHVAGDDEEILLTTVLIDVKAVDQTYIQLRCLLDQGSQISLISENAAQMLGLPRQRHHASISGVGLGSNNSKGMVSLECQSIYKDFNFATQALIIPKVVNNLPNASFSKKTWPHVQNINLADPDYNLSKPIDLLLDASIYSEIIMSGLIKGPIHSPIAQQTKLGWILSGNVKTFNCNVVIKDLSEIQQYWEIEDIPVASSNLTNEEQFCEDYYASTTCRLEDGRYEVALPMKQNYRDELGSTKHKAIGQFHQLENKMKKDEKFANSYKQFIAEYEKLQHMRHVSGDVPSTCYLPHHGVMKLDSTTTKLRVVFNASAKSSSGKSLNDLMESGPNLQQDLQKIILKWRQYKYVVTADIEKMFRQINIRERDQHLQAIIWRESPQDTLQSFYLTTVTYGTKAAPYLAMRTLRQLAKDDREKFPLAATALENSFYMDDFLGGGNSIEETKELRQQLINILKGAGMNLRKWSANDKQLLQDLADDQIDSPYEFRCSDTRKTLGLTWSPHSDSFTFHNKFIDDEKCETKRQLLSAISKIFDPLGWLSPLSIRAKQLFQKTWSLGTKWDEQIPAGIQSEWVQIKNCLSQINQFNIPRSIGNFSKNYCLHGFCDASEKGYACVIYLTAENNGAFTSSLVIAKTKLAPLGKKLSLPRLELCGALLLTQVLKTVLETWNPDNNLKVYAWSDSMITLGWIKGDASRWKQFVANRVQQINNIIPASSWHHVRSEDNPADCATRGVSSANLLEHSLWWKGPQWLETFDPLLKITDSIPAPEIETKKHSGNAALNYNHGTLILETLDNNSSVTRAVKTIAWVLRFIDVLRHRTTERGQALTSAEINKSYHIIIKHVQSLDFAGEIKALNKNNHVHSSSKLAGLNPYLDEQGIIRVGGRLSNSRLCNSSKHPVILSSHGRFTDLIVDKSHITTLHGGPRLTLSYIRERFWIISGMRTVKRQLRRCVKCRRFNAEIRQPIMADLPQQRVTPSRAFTHTGVDFTGHVDLRASKGRGIKSHKGYVAVFVCLATKAAHLELVSDLSTPSFLAAFNRFCARRGTPKVVYSDNGTNFVGASRVLKQEYQQIIKSINTDFINSINDMNIEWVFNSPAFPNAGGLWEALVKSFKRHLKRIIGDQKLTYEEFTTLLQQIEACLNSRPLLPLTENPDDDVLTPGHFLIGGALLSRPQTDPGNVNLPTRWQLIQTMNKQFWKKWSSDYLQHLQIRSRWRAPCKNIEENDIVLVKEDNLPPGKWALGKVQKVLPGKDGHVRVATIKTQNNDVMRPVNKLVPLPVHGNEEEQKHSQQSDSAKQQRPASGRKGLSFKNFFVTLCLLFMALITPSLQSSIPQFNLTALDPNQHLYFDKTADLQYVRDEWKLVVYYNLTSYWQGLSDIKKHVHQLENINSEKNVLYKNILEQLIHELTEIDHLNNIFKQSSLSRPKRGLIDGVGYVANSLFGVLDERFAKQYAKDIEKISMNENHIRNLIKNQTLVIEAEYNIIQRNEQRMNQQFNSFNNQIDTLSRDVNKVKTDMTAGLFITSSALTASIIISNLRRVQNTLVDIVTDITHGHIDTHLLSVEQLQEQLEVISGRLQSDLKLPVEKDDVKDIYKLLKVFARVYKNYLLIEIRIPLVSSEDYQLDRIITIPQPKKKYDTIPTYPFVAFNIKKDMVIFLTELDFHACLHASKMKLLCTINKPIYKLGMRTSICDLKLIGVGKSESPCTSEQSHCINKWVKLQGQNMWLYSCCTECRVRIFCTADMTTSVLTGNGIINLGQGCTLQTDTFVIYAHNNFVNKIDTSFDIEVPEVSILNTIFNSSLPNHTVAVEDHLDYKNLEERITTLKEQENIELSVHDIHQYSVLYAIVAVLLLVGSVICIVKWKKRCQRPVAATTMVLQGQPTVSALSEVGALSEVSVLSEVSAGISGKGVSVEALPQRSQPVLITVPLAKNSVTSVN